MVHSVLGISHSFQITGGAYISLWLEEPTSPSIVDYSAKRNQPADTSAYILNVFPLDLESFNIIFDKIPWETLQQTLTNID